MHSEWPCLLPEIPAEQPSPTQPEISLAGIGFLTLSMGSLWCCVACVFSHLAQAHLSLKGGES